MTTAELRLLAELAARYGLLVGGDRVRAAALTVARSARARLPRGYTQTVTRSIYLTDPPSVVDCRDPEAQIQTGPSPRTPE